MASELERLVERLQRQVAELLAENAALRAKLAEAQARIEELERAAARQAAPFRREEGKKIPPAEQRRPGRRPGHPGAYRQPPRHIDQEIEVPLTGCPHCGGAVTDREPLTQYVEEIPPIRPQVVRLITWSAQCAKCGMVQSTHPLQT